jgi:alanyl-tRNA synthetase
MRRGIRYGVKIGLKGSFLHHTVQSVIDAFGEAYPELRERAAFITDVVQVEEERFAVTLDRGDHRLDRFLAKLLRDLGAAPAGQLCDIGAVGTGAAARADRGFKAFKAV